MIQCPDSPTEAHHRILSAPQGGVVVGVCKVCNDVREYRAQHEGYEKFGMNARIRAVQRRKAAERDTRATSGRRIA